jgi:hypothetical protein
MLSNLRTARSAIVCKLAHANENFQFKSQDLNSEGEPSRDFHTPRLLKNVPRAYRLGSRGQGLHISPTSIYHYMCHCDTQMSFIEHRTSELCI